jgi:hypothetical protein
MVGEKPRSPFSGFNCLHWSEDIHLAATAASTTTGSQGRNNNNNSSTLFK